MHSPAEPSAARMGRLRLVHKLAIAVAFLLLLLAGALLAYVGPATTSGFLGGSRALVQQSIAAMQSLAADQADQSRAVLIDLIEHTTDARQRSLQDLPLPLFADIEQLRAFVAAADAQRATRLRANAAVLGAESRRRAALRIDAVLADLQRHQDELAAAFAADLRQNHLWLCAAVLFFALLVFGFGLWQLVVRPVAVLRAATHRVAAGELTATVPLHSGDELGALAADFRGMVRQLEQSRAALAALNRDLEQKVRDQTRELAHAGKMASIGTLAGGIAHEFNNLIGGIRGCAMEVRRDETVPDRQETLDVILRAADRAAAIVAQLRRFAKDDAPRDVAFDLASVLGDAVALLEPEARRRGVVVERAIAGPLPLRGDDGALHQVFVNLLTNALQAMPDGGSLAVRAAASAGQVTVAIADTGTGIDPADLGRIFEPFFSRRGDAADPAQRGTGLGLSVSYGIVDAHGGSIDVHSEPGRGSTFTVRLPQPPRSAAP